MVKVIECSRRGRGKRQSSFKPLIKLSAERHVLPWRWNVGWDDKSPYIQCATMRICCNDNNERHMCILESDPSGVTLPFCASIDSEDGPGHLHGVQSYQRATFAGDKESSR
ncbi:PREDICTED: uncharacterized protein LOC106750141 isoform X2 [Dinoponera quadriceps]|uniref:Uncharacterized protein LOC106750141 isoform X2 n=1 Tax=Dinoponera quadriceps TaxID=609295 RepID=A0A6P3Y6S5_DINQU|nr:PREDICTED: uncharacterized protein LOC106750141 isoform X2 [Dinoponera quadriceps]